MQPWKCLKNNRVIVQPSGLYVLLISALKELHALISSCVQSITYLHSSE